MKKLLCLVVLVLLMSSVYADKKTTFKGVLQTPTQLSYRWEGIDAHYEVPAGLGFGVEHSFVSFARNRIELIGGFNYMFTRNMSEAVVDGQSYDVNANLDLMQLYFKPRFFFGRTPDKSRVSMYIAGKVAHNIININAPGESLSDSLGMGISTGMVINNRFDLELAVDAITGDLEMLGEMGFYGLPTISLSFGARI